MLCAVDRYTMADMADRTEVVTLDRAREHARTTLAALPVPGRAGVLYAAAATERLFRWYDERPAIERAPYSATWRPVLAAVWAYAGGTDSAYRTISHALGEFYLSPYSNDGSDVDDLLDIDEDEAAATFYTANCVMHGVVDFALWAATRATDRLDFEWSGTDEDRRRAEVLAELNRQAADLELIAATPPRPGYDSPAELIERLRS